jgi:hypothetical protein
VRIKWYNELKIFIISRETAFCKRTFVCFPPNSLGIRTGPTYFWIALQH